MQYLTVEIKDKTKKHLRAICSVMSINESWFLDKLLLADPWALDSLTHYHEMMKPKMLRKKCVSETTN